MKYHWIDYYLPEKVLTNEDLKKQFPEWDYESFEKKVGIKQRHIAAPEETAADMAFQAAGKVLRGFDKKKIDFILLCTQSPDYFLPTSACLLQDKLGLEKQTGALDFNLGCSGYVYGLALAKGLLESGVASNILFVVSETYTKHMHEKDRSNRAIFGDAAAATIISKENFGIGNFVLGTDGSGYKELIVYTGGFRQKYDTGIREYEYGTGNITSDNHLYMNGPEIFNFSIDIVPKIVNRTLEKNNLDLGGVDYFIFHQANNFMLNYLRKKIGIPKEKFHLDIENTGNTVSATIPVGLKNALEEGILKKGDKVMLVGFGVGLSWGSGILEIK